MRSFTKKNIAYTNELYFLIYDGKHEDGVDYDWNLLLEYSDSDDAGVPKNIHQVLKAMSSFNQPTIHRMRHTQNLRKILSHPAFENAYQQLINLWVEKSLVSDGSVNLLSDLNKLKILYEDEISVSEFHMNVGNVHNRLPMLGLFTADPTGLNVDDDSTADRDGALTKLLKEQNPSPLDLFKKLVVGDYKILKNEHDLNEIQTIKNISRLMVLKSVYNYAKIRSEYENLNVFSVTTDDGNTNLRFDQVLYGTTENFPRNSKKYDYSKINEIRLNAYGKIDRWTLSGSDVDSFNVPTYSIESFTNSRRFIDEFLNRSIDTTIGVDSDAFKGQAVLKYLDEHHKSVYGYNYAKLPLVKSHGLYCGFCESPLNDGKNGDIEHKLPKSTFPTESQRWDNFVLACATCNQSYKATNFAIVSEGSLLSTSKKSGIFLNYAKRLGMRVRLKPLFSSTVKSPIPGSNILANVKYRNFNFSNFTAIRRVLMSYNSDLGQLNKALQTARALGAIFKMTGNEYGESLDEFKARKKLPDGDPRRLAKNYAFAKFLAEHFLTLYPENEGSPEKECVKALLIACSYASGYQDLIDKVRNNVKYLETYPANNLQVQNLSEKILNADELNSLIMNHLTFGKDIEVGYQQFLDDAIYEVVWPDRKCKDSDGDKTPFISYKIDIRDYLLAQIPETIDVSVKENNSGYQARFTGHADVLDLLLAPTENVLGLTETGRKFKNILDIAGLNKSSKNQIVVEDEGEDGDGQEEQEGSARYWNDQRKLRRTKAWFHAMKQLKTLKDFQSSFEKLGVFYEYQLDPKNIGKAVIDTNAGKVFTSIGALRDEGNLPLDLSGYPARSLDALKTWDDNRKELLTKLKSVDDYMHSSIWENIKSMVKDGGFYSTWVKTFESKCKPPSAGQAEIHLRYDLELVRLLEIEAVSNPGDPFQFHGTDAKEIVDVLKA